MQNYLQTHKRKKAVFLLLSFAVALTLVLLTVRGIKKAEFNGMLDKSQGASYLTSVFSSLPDKTVETEKNDVNEERKMNNENVKNSKNDVSDTKIILDKADFAEIAVKNDGKIQKMALEEYVVGCVLGEMPAGFEFEALMAQSVAVRTLAVRGMSGQSKHEDADICTDYRCCQSYHSPDKVSKETLEKVKSAADATRGIIITYDNEPILAVYHSSSGEKTLSSKDVWGGDLPYLVSTPSPLGETEVSAFGNGHRVGMSQHGANLLAKEGKSYSDILKYYYKGIALTIVKST